VTYQRGRPPVCRDMDPEHADWRRILRPSGEGFRRDLTSAAGVLAGAALGALVFDAWAVFPGAVIGASFVVVVRAISRGVRRRR
jgi:hypothetical protein